METELILSFDTESTADGNIDVEDLQRHLELVAPAVRTEQCRSDADAQDLGATLVLILGTPAIIAFAKGVADWLRMREKTSLVIRDRKGNTIVELKDARSTDVRALLEGKLGDVIGR